MKRSIVVKLGIAAVFGAGSILAADLWLRSQASAHVESAAPVAAEPKVEFGRIVVAKEPLRYGMALDPARLAEIPWPLGSLPAGAYSSVEADRRRRTHGAVAYRAQRAGAAGEAFGPQRPRRCRTFWRPECAPSRSASSRSRTMPKGPRAPPSPARS